MQKTDLFQELIFADSISSSPGLQAFIYQTVNNYTWEQVVDVVDYLFKSMGELSKNGMTKSFVTQKQEVFNQYIAEILKNNEFKTSSLSLKDLSHFLSEDEIVTPLVKILLKRQTHLGWISKIFSQQSYEEQLQYFLQCNKKQFIDISKIDEAGIITEYFENMSKKPKLKQLLSKLLVLNGDILNLRLFYFIHTAHFLEINYDKVCKLVEEQAWRQFPFLFIPAPKIQQLKALVGENQAWSLIKSAQDEFEVFDSIGMLGNLRNRNPSYKAPKIRVMDDFHRKLIQEANLLNNKNLVFNQSALADIDGLTLPELEISLHLPKSSAELIILGHKLNICVGRANYDVKIAYRNHFILEVRNLDGFPIGCVELVQENNDWEIVQAKSEGNKPLDRLLIKEIYSLIREKVSI